jgi:archaellum component FlaC
MTEEQLTKLEHLDHRLNAELAKFFGQMTKYVDKRFAELRNEIHELHENVDSIRNTVDGIAGDLTADRQERAAITVQQDRQTGWIKQLAEATNTKLQPEL